MTYEIYATITDELGTRCVPTGIWGWSRADLVLELAGLTRRSRNPGETFYIEEVFPEDAFNAW
jgi:hypothetical protein